MLNSRNRAPACVVFCSLSWWCFLVRLVSGGRWRLVCLGAVTRSSSSQRQHEAHRQATPHTRTPARYDTRVLLACPVLVCRWCASTSLHGRCPRGRARLKFRRAVREQRGRGPSPTGTLLALLLTLSALAAARHQTTRLTQPVRPAPFSSRWRPLLLPPPLCRWMSPAALRLLLLLPPTRLLTSTVVRTTSSST